MLRRDKCLEAGPAAMASAFATIFANEVSLRRLVFGVLSEIGDEW